MKLHDSLYLHSGKSIKVESDCSKHFIIREGPLLQLPNMPEHIEHINLQNNITDKGKVDDCLSSFFIFLAVGLFCT